MIKGKHKFDATKDKVLNAYLNSFCDELLTKAGKVKSKTNHKQMYSSLYQLYIQGQARTNIENLHNLVIKVFSSNFTKEQKNVIAQKIKDLISFTAEETLLKVKREQRLPLVLFKTIIKVIVIEQDFFDKYIRNSDKIISAYYKENNPALNENPKTEVTYSSFNKYNKSNKCF